MSLSIARVELWAADIEDQAGGLAQKLAGLSEAGANLEFIFARRSTESPGMGVVFVTPIKGARCIRAAKDLGFQALGRVGVVRTEGPDKKGLAGRMTSAVAELDVTLRGFSATSMHKRSVIHLAFDSVADASRAIRALKKLKF